MALLGGDDIDLTVKTKSDNSGVKDAEEGLGKLQQTTSKVSAATIAMGAAMAQVAMAGLKALAKGLKDSVMLSIDFESQMSNISTLITGDATQAVGKFKDGILEMSKVIPKDPKELGAEAYNILSAGITDTDTALKVLASSAKLGVAGLGSTAASVDIMTSSINAFGLKASDADKISNVLYKSTVYGKVTIEQMAQGFGATAVAVAKAKIPIEEYAAAVGAMTSVGLPAAEANTSLKSAVNALVAPTDSMKKIITGLGFANGELMVKQLGMVGSMEAIRKATGGASDKLKDAYGSVEALNAASSLTGQTSATFKKAFADMKSGADSVTEAFEKQKASTANHMQLLKNNIEVIAIKIGSKLLPVMNEIMTKGIKLMQVGFKELSAWWDAKGKMMWDNFRESLTKLKPYIEIMKNQIIAIKDEMLKFWQANSGWLVPTLKFLGQVIVGTVIVAFMSILQVIKWVWQGFSGIVAYIRESVIPWFTKIFTAVGGVIGSIISIFTTLGQWFGGFIATYLSPFVALWTFVWEGVKNGFSAIWTVIKGTFTIVWEAIKLVFGTVWTFFSGNIKAISQLFKGDFSGAMETVKSTFIRIWDGIKSYFSGTWDAIKSILKGGINGFIGSINAMIKGVNKLKIDIPDWVPGVGGKKWSLNLSEIPKLAVGTPMVESDGLAYLHRGEKVVTAAEVKSPSKGNGWTVNNYFEQGYDANTINNRLRFQFASVI